MKYIPLIIIFLVITSCSIFLGEKKLTYNKTTLYIKPSIKAKGWRNAKFYIIPIDKIKECRDYPTIGYLGSEKGYSFFRTIGKYSYTYEILQFALPDLICTIKYPNTIDNEIKIYHGNRDATIMDNKMVVADN